MTTIRMVTYNPLCFNSRGKKAINKWQLDPFKDGSIRPEPSLEHDVPGISSLCRKSKLAPLLNKGDIVVYLTKKDIYDTVQKHRKLVAVLCVDETFSSHQEAANWFIGNGFQLPKNVVVNGNQPLQEDMTSFSRRHAKLASIDYINRAKDFPRYNICKIVYRNTKNPPSIYDTDLLNIFGREPGTQSPCKVTWKQLDSLLLLAIRRKPIQT